MTEAVNAVRTCLRKKNTKALIAMHRIAMLINNVVVSACQ
ncbi:hypothetical protein Pvag_pPag10041 (plasmid) [Pantoea vagans C9-1]|nr:hypothetical protein Pvag_pPag10041 [Pantoea vagans C9-1]